MFTLEKQNRLFLLLISCALIALVGFIDFRTGYELSFALFYLVPVALVAWYVNVKYGVVISFISAATWQTVNLMAGEVHLNLITPYWNTTTRLGFFIVVTFLLSRLKIALEREKALSRTDYLTGVANNRSFYETAAMELNRSRRYRHPLTVAYLDLDNFKDVNDSFGHTVGDEALQVVAKTILRHTRATDVVARLGGDEFAVLLPETDYNAARGVISRIHEVLLSEMEKNRWSVTFSIGVLTYVSPPEEVDELIRVVDNLMYEVKKNGKNRIEYKVV
ncbi:MAG TPA: GGDEF domain-containing protein [Thermodesulfobacteriota bacterium]|nr:GGDEF domain-containing protein [Thermodesulfobacteriota bacterium]